MHMLNFKDHFFSHCHDPNSFQALLKSLWLFWLQSCTRWSSNYQFPLHLPNNFQWPSYVVTHSHRWNKLDKNFNFNNYSYKYNKLQLFGKIQSFLKLWFQVTIFGWVGRWQVATWQECKICMVKLWVTMILVSSLTVYVDWFIDLVPLYLSLSP